MRIHLIVNPHARRLERSGALRRRLLAAASRRCHVHVTRDLDELERAASDLAGGEVDLVVMAGGDGTLMAGLSALARGFGARGRPMPAVAAVPAGTVSTVPRNFGIAGDPVRWLERVLDAPSQLRAWPTLSVAVDNERRVGFIFGTGLVARFFELYYAQGAPGYAGSAAIVARVFAESFVGGPFARAVLEPLPCKLEVDGRAESAPAWSLVCAAVVRNLGIHMLVTYRAAEDPQRPHLVATSLPPRALGPRMPRVLAGRTIGGEVDGLVQRFVVDFAGGRVDGPPGPYVLDGELLRARRVCVQAGPALRLWMPRATRS